MKQAARVEVHAALGEPHRLAIVDELRTSDRTVAELATLVGVEGNLLAHHLKVLEQAGVILRRVSDGDRRYRYVSLDASRLAQLDATPGIAAGRPLFVCSHNSARSQFAAALWAARTGRRAQSAGTRPAPTVHPKAIRVAGEYGLDLVGAHPKGYAAVSADVDLIVSVCDRAREETIPIDAPRLHWSVPDPVAEDTLAAFRAAFAEIADRVDRLAEATIEEEPS